MIIIDKKRMTATVVKYPRVYVIQRMFFILISINILVSVGYEMYEGIYATPYYWNLLLGLYLLVSSVRDLNKVESFIVKAFTGRRK